MKLPPSTIFLSVRRHRHLADSPTGRGTWNGSTTPVRPSTATAPVLDVVLTLEKMPTAYSLLSVAASP